MDDQLANPATFARDILGIRCKEWNSETEEKAIQCKCQRLLRLILLDVKTTFRGYDRKN